MRLVSHVSRQAARPIPEGMTVFRLGQYGRPPLETAGLVVPNWQADRVFRCSFMEEVKTTE